MQPVPIWRRPLLVFEVERESTLVGIDQAATPDRAIGDDGQCLDQASAFVASTRDQFWVEPDQVGIVVQVPRRKIIDVVLFEDAPQEIDRLIQGIECIHRVKSGHSASRT